MKYEEFEVGKKYSNGIYVEKVVCKYDGNQSIVCVDENDDIVAYQGSDLEYFKPVKEEVDYVGKVCNDRHGDTYFVTSVDGDRVYGYGFFNNRFTGKYGWENRSKGESDLVASYISDAAQSPVTKEEWLEKLSEYAESKGYKNGNYKCLCLPEDTVSIEESSQFFAFADLDEISELWIESSSDEANLIMEDGVWAEIIEPEKGENKEVADFKAPEGSLILSPLQTKDDAITMFSFWYTKNYLKDIILNKDIDLDSLTSLDKRVLYKCIHSAQMEAYDSEGVLDLMRTCVDMLLELDGEK
ncbi:MAG: hypothetical protein WD512_13300 [Candidatus Paceibacterota bacterium]